MKSKRSPETMAAFFSGVIFAWGLALSGMTQPGKVTSFLDFTGFWDPSLAFVMMGAIGVYAIGYRKVLKRKKPLFTDAFQIPKNKTTDTPLFVGAALFGMGWGLVGFCPAPALTSLVTFRFEPLLFVFSMFAGMILFQKWQKRMAQRGAKSR